MIPNKKITILVASLRSVKKDVERRNIATIETLRVQMLLDEAFMPLCRITGLRDEDIEITSAFDKERSNLGRGWKVSQTRYITKDDCLRLLDELINNAIENAAANGWCVEGEEPPEASPTPPAADETTDDKKKPPEAITGGTKNRVKLLSCLEAASRAINEAIALLAELKEAVAQLN
ncbi:MAG: hypothetical protein J6Q03_00135 [Paludibacteraceae bacterium]|nr:hypothetical protein [Paludibacteraceae bacterium]MBO6102666.1 hypothetical protein [Opitutales bacterium]MBO7144258.1 hypothetical protein [Salinivirgaceae bacterium]